MFSTDDRSELKAGRINTWTLLLSGFQLIFHFLFSWLIFQDLFFNIYIDTFNVDVYMLYFTFMQLCCQIFARSSNIKRWVAQKNAVNHPVWIISLLLPLKISKKLLTLYQTMPYSKQDEKPWTCGIIVDNCFQNTMHGVHFHSLTEWEQLLPESSRKVGNNDEDDVCEWKVLVQIKEFE